MDFLKDRRVALLAGAAIALVGGLGAAGFFLSRSHPSAEPPPASQGGLVVETGRDDDQKLDPKRPRRCFVGGQFVGELPLEVCAQRNGVATGALDVGLDQAGALAASNGASADITPLPPQQPPNSQPVTEAMPPDGQTNEAAAPVAQAGGDDCWRYGAGGWRRLSAPLTLNACVGALFAGRCPGPDQAFYGRWGDEALRLVDGRVEISPDNSDFHALVDPWPPCQAAFG